MGELHLICGSDTFAVKERARNFIEGLCGEKWAEDPSLEILDASDVKSEEFFSSLLGSLRTPPFLSPRQIIWVRNFDFFDQLDKDSEAARGLLEALTRPLPEYQTLLISGASPDMRRSVGKKLKAAAVTTVLNASDASDKNFAAERRLQIKDFSAASGVAVRPDAAQYLADNLGSDSGVLHNELEKLLCYVGDRREITLQDCRDVAAHTPEAVIWNFTAALVGRDASGALRMLDMLLRQGDAELKLAAMISSEFQRIIQTKGAMAELGISGRVGPGTFDSLDPALKARHPDNPLLKLHPFRAFKMCESAAAWSREDLVGALRAATAANRALVTGGGEPRIVLEQLILALCR